jgi:hypothetical protein
MSQATQPPTMTISEVHKVVLFPAKERMPLRWRKVTIGRRVRKIGKVLNLPDWEVERACNDEIELCDFIYRYGQSYEWVFAGDVDMMIKNCATRRGWRRT